MRYDQKQLNGFNGAKTAFVKRYREEHHTRFEKDLDNLINHYDVITKEATRKAIKKAVTPEQFATICDLMGWQSNRQS